MFKIGDLVRFGGAAYTIVYVIDDYARLASVYTDGYFRTVSLGYLTAQENDIPQNDAGESWEVFCPRTGYTVATVGSEATAIAVCDNYPNLDYSRTGF
jgi:hypothetical protein